MKKKTVFLPPLIDDYIRTLSLIDADRFCLMLMLLQQPLAITPGVTHVGAYHRSPDSNFLKGRKESDFGGRTIKASANSQLRRRGGESPVSDYIQISD